MDKIVITEKYDRIQINEMKKNLEKLNVYKNYISNNNNISVKEKKDLDNNCYNACRIISNKNIKIHLHSKLDDMMCFISIYGLDKYNESLINKLIKDDPTHYSFDETTGTYIIKSELNEENILLKKVSIFKNQDYNYEYENISLRSR